MTLSTGNSYLDSLGAAAATATSGSGTSSSSQTIDQAGFLKLLTTQLQTQDPTDTQDTNAMVQQMATFSQVAGITEMNSSLKTISDNLSASRFDASGWLGRDALVASDSVGAISSGAFAGEITLPAAAKDVTLSLVDANGNTVNSQDLGAKSAGAVDWSWNGKDASGAAVSGPLRIIVTAPAATGSGSVTPSNAAWTEIQSVQSPATGTTKLTTGLGTIDPSAVLQLG
ncbi:flagellar basal-body rod modification protein FlgD [Sphingomonas vulcanisoli]|uniref:Basal-body rod modification protein FlgD n=1 Tax=Sphingomonas vulcanisoli TaxID=1658060 RepID=A0ABX0TX19_9SPHN|nr:flagellar hook capping FlgD N-terminal domain-containing protein [Sphingomonas vulcanisoli]NIJ08990.1 flagellar basal-body rod modification protein FlgD [Sphingomonas vulcanisoli]